MKPRILFVDDQALILELLKVTIESTPDAWEARFAGSGQEALQLMAAQPFDVVVSDMHMPGMSGVQLLNEVLVQHPNTIRIMLCGGGEQEQIMGCLGATHQFLAKPFRVMDLQATLTRCQSLRARLPDAEIRKLLGKRDRLPSIPAVYLRILEAVQEPNCPTQRIGEIVSTDPALTAKLLQLVNSAFFGVAREVSNPEEAVLLLGVAIIRTLALTVHLFSAFDTGPDGGSLLQEIWAHSMRVGKLAKQIVESQKNEEHLAEQALTAGLLHDVGKLILAENVGERYLDLAVAARAEGKSLPLLEREFLGANHAEVGGYLLDLWGLPVSLVEAVALHHEPLQSKERSFSPLTAVHVANGLAKVTASDKRPLSALDLDAAYLRQLHLEESVEAWRERFCEAPPGIP